MHMVLLIVGLLSGATGVAMLAYGAANYTAAIGNTLILSGTTAVVGGLIIIGLGAVVSRIRRLAEALDRQPMPRIADERFDVGRFEPEERTTAVPGLEAVPSTVGKAPPPSLADEPPAPPIVEPDTHQGVGDEMLSRERDAATTDVVPDTGTRSDSTGRQAEVARPHAEWPHVTTLDHIVDDEVPAGSVEPPDAASKPYRDVPLPPPLFERSATAPVEPPVPPAPPVILKSGVLDGMAYTLYSDGSIEAEQREGTMRFRSIPELRAYMSERAR